MEDKFKITVNLVPTDCTMLRFEVKYVTVTDLRTKSSITFTNDEFKTLEYAVRYARYTDPSIKYLYHLDEKVKK